MQLTLVTPRCSICTWKITPKISLSLQNGSLVKEPATNICLICGGHMASNARGVVIRQPGQLKGMNTVAVNVTFKRQSLRGLFFTEPVNRCDYGSKRCGA